MKITKKSTVEITDITDADRLNFLQEQTSLQHLSCHYRQKDDVNKAWSRGWNGEKVPCTVIVTNWAVVTKGDDIRKAIDRLIKSKVENDNA